MITISPKYLFLAIWILPLFGAQIFNSHLINNISVTTVAMVVGHVFLVFLSSSLFGNLIKEKIQFGDSCFFKTVNIIVFQRRTDQLFTTWLFLYFVVIIASNGLPIAWLLIGNGKTYMDFGVMSLSGFCNMLRACCISALYLLNLGGTCLQSRRRNWYKIGFLITSAFVLEMARGNGIVMLLHAVGIHFLLKRFTVYRVAQVVLVLIVFLFTFGYFQFFRYGYDDAMITQYLNSVGFGEVDGVLKYFVPSITYICLPIVNTDLNIRVAPDIKFDPFYSLTLMLPTFLRNLLVGSGDYGELVNEANNVSSYYIPFIRDFGVIGCGIFVSPLLVFSMYVYARARSGSPYYFLIWPPIFMSLMLSFFSLFFLSLVVLLYPLAVLWLLRGAVRQKS